MHGKASYGMVWHPMAWHGMGYYGMARYGMAMHGKVPYGMVLHSMTCHIMAWHRMAWCVTVWLYGLVWHGIVRQGIMFSVVSHGMRLRVCSIFLHATTIPFHRIGDHWRHTGRISAFLPSGILKMDLARCERKFTALGYYCPYRHGVCGGSFYYSHVGSDRHKLGGKEKVTEEQPEASACSFDVAI